MTVRHVTFDSNPSIYSFDDSLLHGMHQRNGIIEGYGNNLGYNTPSSSTFEILSGALLIEGRLVLIEAGTSELISVTLPASGEETWTIYAQIDLSVSNTPVTFNAKKGTSMTQDNMADGGSLYQLALYELTVSQSITNVDKKVNDVINVFDLYTNQNKMFVPEQNGSKTSTDLNDINFSGFYFATDTTLNTPVSGKFFGVIHTNDRSTTSGSTQIAISYNDGDMYYRKESGNVWASWKQLATTDELNVKVDKVTGKGLSTEDYTTTDKDKVANVPSDTKSELSNKLEISDLNESTILNYSSLSGNYSYSATMGEYTKFTVILKANNGADVNAEYWRDSRRIFKSELSGSSDTSYFFRLRNPSGNIVDAWVTLYKDSTKIYIGGYASDYSEVKIIGEK